MILLLKRINDASLHICMFYILSILFYMQSLVDTTYLVDTIKEYL